MADEAWMTGAQQSGSGPASIPRTITVWTAPFITAAAMIDAGVFATLGPATEKAGSGISLAIVLAGLLALASGTSGAQLGAAFPISGGAFIWTRKVGMAARLSFVAGSWFLGKEVISQSVNALVLLTYAKALIPGVPVHLIAATAVMAVTILNYLGVQPTAKVLVALTLLLVALLVGYVGLVARAFALDRLSPVFGTGAGGVLGGAGTFFLTFAGFQRIAVIASEVAEPKRTIPHGIYTDPVCDGDCAWVQRRTP